MSIIRIITGGPQTVWSNGGSVLYHAASGPIPSSDGAAARVTQELAAKTAGLTGVKFALRFGNDLVSWDAWAPATGATGQTTNGTQHDDTWLDLRTGYTVRRYLQLGWQVTATGATLNELGSMTWRIELRSD